MAAVYRLEHLTKIYKGAGRKANDDLALDIRQGEIFGLLRPNGAGKPMPVNRAAGLVRPTAWSIPLFGGDVVKQPGLVADYIALQPQHRIGLGGFSLEAAIFATARRRGLATATAARTVGVAVPDETSGRGGTKHSGADWR